MSMEQRIRRQLADHLRPVHVDLRDESHQHSAGRGAQSHWNLVIVSDAFTGKRLVQRHRAVYQALGAELRDGIHALTMMTLDPGEWAAAGEQAENPSPACPGGSKHG